MDLVLPLNVLEASSIYGNDETKWGPELALTDLSKTSTGYWHSGFGDQNPYIIFYLDRESEVTSVEITDRLDQHPERFSNVQVMVTVDNPELTVIDCGTKSYEEKEIRTYRYVLLFMHLRNVFYKFLL